MSDPYEEVLKRLGTTPQAPAQTPAPAPAQGTPQDDPYERVLKTLPQQAPTPAPSAIPPPVTTPGNLYPSQAPGPAGTQTEPPPTPYAQIGIGERLIKEHPDEILNAIRHAEGTPTYGIMGLPKGASEAEARRWARNTMYSKYADWEKAGKPGDYLQYLASRYAPIGAQNDPTNLNANWLPNVQGYLTQRGLMPRGPTMQVPEAARIEQLTPAQRALASRYLGPGALARAMGGPPQPVPTVPAPAAFARGFLRGVTAPFGQALLPEQLGEPTQERGIARVAETAGEFGGYTKGPLGFAFTLANRLLPGMIPGTVRTILQNGGAGALYGITNSIASRWHELEKMPPEQAALQVLRDGGLTGASFAATGGVLHVATEGLIRAAQALGPGVVSGLRMIRDALHPEGDRIPVTAPTAESEAVAAQPRPSAATAGIVPPGSQMVQQWITSGQQAIQSAFRAIAPAEAPGGPRGTAFGQMRNFLIGDRDIFMNRSRNFAVREVQPKLDTFAKIAGDEDRNLLDGAMTLYIDRLGNPTKFNGAVQGAMQAYPELTPFIERMNRMTPDEKLYAEQVLNQYDQARGQHLVDREIMEQKREFHVQHLWDATQQGQDIPMGPSGSTLSPYLGAAQQRTFDTIPEGIVAGLRPRTLSWVATNMIEDGDTARAVMAKGTREALVQSGEGRWSVGPVSNWVDMSRFQRTFQKPFIMRDPATGQDVAAVQRFWVSPQAARGIQYLFERDPFRDVIPSKGVLGGPDTGLLDKVFRYNSFIKGMELSYSFFHDLNLARMFFYNHPLRSMTVAPGAPGVYQKWGPVAYGMQLIKDMPPVLERLIRNGLVVDRTNVMDAYYTAMGGETRWGLNNAFVRAKNRALWETLHPALKAADAVMTVQEALKKFSGRINPATKQAWTEDDIFEHVASVLNDRYGGLNWDRMGTTMMMRRLMRTLILAPDWTFSNLRLGAKAFAGGFDPLSPGTLFARTPSAWAARQSFAKTAVMFTALLQGSSLLLNGHTTFQNAGGRWYSLELPWDAPDGRKQYADFLLPAEMKDLIRVGTALAQRDPQQAVQLARNKAAPLTGLGLTIASGTDYAGRKFIDPGMTAGEKALAYAGQAAPRLIGSLAPIGLSPVWQFLTQPNNPPDLVTSIARGTGFAQIQTGALVPGTMWQSVPNMNKQEFLNQWLTPDQRADFLQQLATGRVSGELAERFQKYVRRYSYRRSLATRGETPEERYRPPGTRLPPRQIQVAPY